MPRPADSPAGGDRIAKLLARAGVASRREVERMIAEGRVALDGTVLATPATVLASLAGVTVDGNPVAAAEPARLFLYHKPVGLLVTERDPRGRPTIYDRLPPGLPRVVPVGRLDAGTEGLLLLTTDGGLKRELELPATGVERSYRARAHGRVGQAALEELIHGIEIEGIRYGPIDANLERRTGANAWIELTLTEGKNREVRRVLEHLGVAVNRLIRTRYGPFVLGDLPAGAVGEVRAADLAAFRQALAAKRPRTDQRIAVTHAAAPQPRPPRKPRPISASAEKLDLHPREGGSPVAPVSGRRLAGLSVSAGAGRMPPTPRASQPGPGLRRGGAPAEQPTAKGTAAAAEPTPPRPAKPQRKSGWARPKPKTGPGKPRKR